MDESSAVSEKASVVVVRHSIPAPAADVWAAVEDQAGWVATVDDVLGVEVLSVDRELGGEPVERVVSWRVWLKGFELRWQETQQLDWQAKRLDFQQIEGMFATYAGYYQVTARGDTTDVELCLQIGTGMPYLAGIIDPVITHAFDAFAHELLRGLERVSPLPQPA